MKISDYSFSESVNLLALVQDNEKVVSDIILMEKDARGLSYTDLAQMLNETNFIYKEIYGGVLPSIAEKIKQVLHNKTPDMELVQNLCKVMNIEDNLHQRIAAYRYKSKKVKQSGRISELKKEENKINYKKIQDDICSSDDGARLIEEAIIEGFSTQYYYEGDWIEPDLYDALIEERQEKEMLKKLLLINNQFPNEMKKFLEQFEVEETDTEFMEKIRIEIGR